MWETWVYDMMTGDLLHRVRPSAFPWSTGLLGDGSAEVTFKTDDARYQLTRAQVWSYFRPNARGLALLWGDHVTYAGKVESWRYDRNAQTVAVRTVEMRGETAWRLTYGVNAYAAGTVSVVNRSISGAVRAIFARFTQLSPEYAYPIDLPADGAGTFSAVWEFWRKFRISDLLTQVEQLGYEIYLRPYLTAGRTGIRYQVRVAPKVTIGASAFVLQAPMSPLDEVSYTYDGVNEITGLQGLGNGTGQDQAVAWAGSTTGQDIPVRDTKATFADLTGSQLQDATNAALAADQDPLVQLSVGKFHLSETWPAEHVTPGRVWNLHSRNDPVIPDSTHVLRVIRASGGLARAVTVEVQSAA